MLSMDDFKGMLRRALGDISIAKLSDAQAEDAVSAAIREYSKYRPIQTLDSLVTISQQPTYDLSAKTRIIRVKDLYYNTSGSEWAFEPGWPAAIDPGTLGGIGSLEGISIFENPSIWMQYMARLESFRRIFDGDFEFDESGKILTLIPEPLSNGIRVFFNWTALHVAGTVPEIDADLIVLWAKAEAKVMVASRQISEIRSVSGYGQSISFGVSAADLESSAKELKQEFRKKLGGAIITTG